MWAFVLPCTLPMTTKMAKNIYEFTFVEINFDLNENMK